MLWKCCTQYVSKFWKLSNGHRTGKGQFSFQCQRMFNLPHNCTHLTRFKLDSEKAEEPEIKLPTSTGSLKRQENLRKTSTSALLTTPKPLTVWKVNSLSHVRLFPTPWTIAYQAPPSMGFSRQEYWTGLPFPSPGNLPNPGIEPGSPLDCVDHHKLWKILKRDGAIRPPYVPPENLYEG